MRSHRTTSCVSRNCLLPAQRWRWRRRPRRRTPRWRTQSNCRRGVCACQPVASVSRCSSWWIWPSTLCAKPLEAPPSGMLQRPEIQRSDDTQMKGKQSLCLYLCSSLQLFFTVRNIFQLFYDVVPTYHKWERFSSRARSKSNSFPADAV